MQSCTNIQGRSHGVVLQQLYQQVGTSWQYWLQSTQTHLKVLNFSFNLMDGFSTGRLTNNLRNLLTEYIVPQ